MTTPRTIDDYGGTFADALPVEDPTVEQSSDYGNRLHEDVAQLTRTTPKAIVTFPTSAAAPAAISAASVSARLHYGTGASTKPTVAKTGTGVYTLTFAASYTDGLSESESLTLFSASATVDAGTTGHAQASCSGVVVTVKVRNPVAGTPFDLSDLGGSVPITVVVW